MRKLIFAVLTVAALGATAMTEAQAAQGCGPYGHRNWHGFCVPGGQWGPGPRYGYGWHRPYGWHRHWGGPGPYWHRGW